MSRFRPLRPRSVLLALRVVSAGLLATMAGGHLYHWNAGYSATAGSIPAG